MRDLAFKALLRRNPGYFDIPENSIGALTTRLSDDAAAMKGATGGWGNGEVLYWWVG